jgi:hypothetical protein
MPDTNVERTLIKAVSIDQDAYEKAVEKARELNMTWSEYVTKTLKKFLENA